jgi:hypothetical protein
MSTIDVSIQHEGDETVAACSCCGRPLYEGRGLLKAKDGDLADYWYQWSEGHMGRFVLAISPCNEYRSHRRGVAVVSGRIDSGNLIYTVLDAVDSPWAATKSFPVLDREEALSISDLFNLVDAIAANERRISSRILECGNMA